MAKDVRKTKKPKMNYALNPEVIYAEQWHGWDHALGLDNGEKGKVKKSERS